MSESIEGTVGHRSLVSGHVAEVIDDPELASKFGTSSKHGAVRLNPGGMVLPYEYLEFADDMHNFKVRSDDVFIVSLPRTGSHWITEIVWTLLNNINFDNPVANAMLQGRTPSMSMDYLTARDKTHGVPYLKMVLKSVGARFDDYPRLIDWMSSLPSPRVLKTHDTLSIMPKDALKNAKVIYVQRDMKDQCVSFYMYLQMLKQFKFEGTFEEFLDLYMNNKMICSPFWNHVREAYDKIDHPNLLIVKYERLKMNCPDEILRIADFIGVDITKDMADQISKYTSFENMKIRDVRDLMLVMGKNIEDLPGKDQMMKLSGIYCRKGEVGTWGEVMNAELSNKFDKWTEQNAKGIDTDSM